MRYHEILGCSELPLFELADMPYSFDRVFQAKDETRYVFHTSDKNLYTVTFERWMGTVELNFACLDNEKAYSVNGLGDQFKVFSTVIAIVADFVAKDDIGFDKLEFSATEPSRIKLYDRLAKRMAAIVPDLEYLGTAQEHQIRWYEFQHRWSVEPVERRTEKPSQQNNSQAAHVSI